MVKNQYFAIRYRVLKFLRRSLWLGYLLALSVYAISYANESKPVDIPSCLPDEIHRPLPDPTILRQGYFFRISLPDYMRPSYYPQFKTELFERLFTDSFTEHFYEPGMIIPKSDPNNLLTSPQTPLQFRPDYLLPHLWQEPEFPYCKPLIRECLPSNAQLLKKNFYRYDCLIDANRYDELREQVITKLGSFLLNAPPYRFSDFPQRIKWLSELSKPCQNAFDTSAAVHYTYVTGLPAPKKSDHPMRIRQYLHYLDESLFIEKYRFYNNPSESFFYRPVCLPQWTWSSSPRARVYSHQLSAKELLLYDLSLPANAPAYPSKLTGPQLVVLGTTNLYEMELDTKTEGQNGKEHLEDDEVHYRFTVHNITGIVKQGLTGKLKTDALLGKTLTGGEEISAWASHHRDLSRRLDHFIEDGRHSIQDVKHGAKSLVQGELVSGFNETFVNSANLLLAPVSALVSLGGAFVHSLAEWTSGEEQSRQIPLPKKEGYYLIRSIATPKTRLGTRRASSVSIIIVEVRSAVHLAQDALGTEKAKLAELELQDILAQTPSEKEAVAKNRAEILLQFEANPEEVLAASVKNLKSSLSTLTQPTDESARKDILERLQKTESLQQFARKQRIKIGGTVVRIKAVFVGDERNQASYPLLLQVACSLFNKGRTVCNLSDVTSQEGSQLYRSEGKTTQEALWQVLTTFAGQADYGRGALAIEIPSGRFLEVQKRSDILRVAPRGTKLAKERLADMALVLTIVGFWVPVAGQFAISISAGLAVERLLKRLQNETLSMQPKSWDAQSVLDVFMVLGAATSGLGHLGQFVQVRWGQTFALATQGTHVTKLQAALQSFDKGVRATNLIFAAGGIVTGNVQLLNQLKEVEAQELEGTITHSEARQIKIHFILQALSTHALFLHGLNAGLKSASTASTLAKATAPSPLSRHLEVVIRIAEQKLSRAGYTQEAALLRRSAQLVQQGKLKGFSQWAARAQQLTPAILAEQISQFQTLEAFIDAGAGQVSLDENGRIRITQFGEKPFQAQDAPTKSKPPTSSPPTEKFSQNEVRSNKGTNTSDLELWSRKVKLGNSSSPTTKQLYEHRMLTVREYTTRFRKGIIQQKIPSEAMNVSVEKALIEGVFGGINLRKLLINTREKFTK